MRDLLIGMFRRGRIAVARYGVVGVAQLGAKLTLSKGSRIWGNIQSPSASKLGADTQDRWQDVAYLAEISGPNWMHGYPYTPAPEAMFCELMEGLRIRFEDFTFIDVGSGKGNALLIATRYPFRQILGVEYAESLHKIAEKNIATYLQGRTDNRQIRSIHGDAMTFPLPDEPTVCFLNNPFDDTVMEPVVRNIVESLRRKPRPFFVVYMTSLYADVYRRHGFKEIARNSDSLGTHVLFEAPSLVNQRS